MEATKSFLTFTDTVLVLATIAGPILAIQIQKLLEQRREKKSRRERIFKTLMATRAARLSGGHVEALNQIDIEFSANNRNDKKVRSAWRAYFAQLSVLIDDAKTEALVLSKREDLFIDLLYEMGMALGYDFDKTQIRTGVYSPLYHGDLERDERLIRTKLIEI